MIVGDAQADKPIQTVKLSKPYPHGIAIHDGIDRILVTSTVRASDLGDAGETITAIEASTGKVLDSYKVSKKASPAGEAPVEILFVPGRQDAGGLRHEHVRRLSLDRDLERAEEGLRRRPGARLLGAEGRGAARDVLHPEVRPDVRHHREARAPAHLRPQGRPGKPKLVKSIATAEGAHHVAFTKDWRYAFVQNALLNLPGMSDGSITIVDLKEQKVIGSVDTLKNKGYNPNSIVLLPKWNHLAGH